MEMLVSAADIAKSQQRRSAAPAGSVGRHVICFPFAGGAVGGSHLSALKLIKGLDRSRFEPLVLLGKTDDAVSALFHSEGLAFEAMPLAMPLPLGARPGPLALACAPWRIARLAAYLRSRGVAIVHTNEGAMHVNWTIAARLAGLPHVWHHRGNPRAMGLRWLSPLFATRIIAVSRFAAPPERILSTHKRSQVIYSPFDQTIGATDRVASREAVGRELGITPATKIVSYLGHFAERKRPHQFVAALVAYRSAYPDRPVIGLMLGTEERAGEETALRATIAQLGATDLVRLMGFRRPIEPWLAASDVLAVPAIEEPFGRTLIEAMLIGTPVVAAASGGNIEAIRHGETGLLVPPDDVTGFVAGLHAILDDERQAASIAARARVDAMRKFSAANHIRQVMAVYEDVLAP